MQQSHVNKLYLDADAENVDKSRMLISLHQAVDKERAYREVMQKMAFESLFFVAKEICGYKDIVEHCHLDVCHGLQRDTKRKLITMPRGTFKSSITSVAYPIWLLINNPNLRIMIDSEKHSNAVNYLREIKAHMKSRKFTRLFGDWEGTIWRDDEILVNCRTQVKKESSIFVSGIGSEQTGKHMDIIIADDLCSPTNTKSKELQQKTIEHYKMFTSLLDPGGTIAVIGTRYSEGDIIGWIMREQLGIDSVKELDKLKHTGV